jgi:ATP-dependent 26S proteasome regulatory subunit
MAVPCRRGVLLHGPPGNGKTSIIRLVGSMLPEIPVLLLRPHGNFSSEDLSQVIRRWTRQAPAILVIEDLNWLLKSIDISMFLNVLDGIDSPDASGLLLIATTNYPEQLDPAINNRPGRFDVVIEVASPDAATREQFFRTKLPGFSEATIAGLVSSSDRFAFAHLQEVLRLSGLLAIYESRAQRSDNHLFQAAKMVQNSFEDATRGFPGRPEVPFGLEYLRKLPRRGE